MRLLICHLLVFTIVFAQDDPIAFYPFNGNFDDVSGNGNNGILTEAQYCPDRFENEFSAIHLDGSGDYGTITSNQVLENAETISISIWYSPGDSLEFAAGRLVNQDDQYAGDLDRSFYLRVDGLGNNRYQVIWNVYNTSLTTTGVLDTITIHPGEWIMVTGSYDGLQQKLFINDLQVAELEVSLPRQIGNAPLYLGRSSYDITWLNGRLDDLRIYNRALADSEIVQLYNQESENRQLVAYYPLDGNAQDLSGNGYNGEISGHEPVAALNRFEEENSAYYFDGVDDFVDLPEGLIHERNAISCFAWVKVDDYSSGMSALSGDNNDSQNGCQELLHFRADSQFVVQLWRSDGGTSNIAPLPPFVIDSWMQVGWTYDGLRFRSYLNGSIVAEEQLLAGAVIQPGNLTIGRRANGGYDFNGWIDDVGFYNYALSENEISELYHENGWDTYLPVSYFFDDFSINDTANWTQYDGGSNNVNIDESNPGEVYIDGARNWESACRVTHEMHTGSENFSVQFDVAWTGGASGAFAVGWSATNEYPYIQSHTDYSTSEEWDDFIGFTIGPEIAHLQAEIGGIPVEGSGSITTNMNLNEWYTFKFRRVDNTITGEIWTQEGNVLLGELAFVIPAIENYSYFHISSWDNMMNSVHSYFSVDNLALQVGDNADIAILIGTIQSNFEPFVLIPVELQTFNSVLYRAAEFDFSGYDGGLEFVGIDTVGTLIGGLDWTWAENESDGFLQTAFAGTQEISGEGVFCYLEFLVVGAPCTSVPVNCDYAVLGTSEVMDISNGTVYIEPIPLYGDVDLNGIVQAQDASDVFMYVIDSLQLECPNWGNADVNLDGVVDAMDASLILQFMVDSIDSLPVMPEAPEFLASGTLWMEGVGAHNGQPLLVPLMLENGNNIYACQGVLNYDPTVFTLNELQPLEFSAEQPGFQINYTDDGEGRLKFAAARVHDQAPSGGLFAWINFDLVDNLVLGEETVLSFESFKLNHNLVVDVPEQPFSGNEGEIQSPTVYTLKQNYPNPFNPSTTIRYGLPEDSEISVTIYDVRGVTVRELFRSRQPAGWHELVWNGISDNGSPAVTGIYFARLTAGAYIETIKMVYLK